MWLRCFEDRETIEASDSDNNLAGIWQVFLRGANPKQSKISVYAPFWEKL